MQALPMQLNANLAGPSVGVASEQVVEVGLEVEI